MVESWFCIVGYWGLPGVFAEGHCQLGMSHPPCFCMFLSLSHKKKLRDSENHVGRWAVVPKVQITTCQPKFTQIFAKFSQRLIFLPKKAKKKNQNMEKFPIHEKLHRISEYGNWDLNNREGCSKGEGWRNSSTSFYVLQWTWAQTFNVLGGDFFFSLRKDVSLPSEATYILCSRDCFNPLPSLPLHSFVLRF